MIEYGIYGLIFFIVGLVIWMKRKRMYKPLKGNGLRLLVPIPILLIGGTIAILQIKGHINIWYELAGLAFGILLSIPLIYTTNYEIRDDNNIYAVRNKAFFVSIVVLIVIRLLLRDYLATFGVQTEMLIFLAIGFGYVIPWRVASYTKFRKVKQTLSATI